MEKETNINPEEVSFEDAAQAQQLRELLEQKILDKQKLNETKGLKVLKKSKFYYGVDDNLREHIATYNGMAILLKQEEVPEELNDKEQGMTVALVTLPDLKKMKKVNGNIVRKINPKTIHEFEKMAAVQSIILELDKDI